MQAENLLDGQWKLVYTSNSELFGLLALSRLPFVSIGDITQKIEGSTLTVENKVRQLLPSIPLRHNLACMARLSQLCLCLYTGVSVCHVWFGAVVHDSWNIC